jgi:hypothetical protein
MATVVADVAVATAVLWTWVLFAGLNTAASARIEWLVDWTAPRALVPFLIGAVEPLVPAGLADVAPFDGMVKAFSEGFVATPPALAIAALAVMLPFIVLAIRATRRLLAVEAPELGAATRSAIAWATAASLLVLMIGRNNFGRPYLGHVYDPATLGFTAACLALLAERRWRAYVAALAVAAVNRETAIFLIPVFCLFAWPLLERRRFAGLLAVQVVSVVAIRGALELAARDLPTMDRSLKLAILPATDFLPIDGEAIGVVFALALFTLGRLYTSGLALASLVMVPIAVVAYLLAGEPGEYRVFLEIVPVAALACGALLGARPVALSAPLRVYA